jgi:acylphosphatase
MVPVRVKVRAHTYVSGRVQGVFFRSSVADLAEQLGVAGWVRNLYDGRVEALLEGEKSSVEQVVEFCRRGPRGAHVTDLKVSWEEWRGEFPGFEVLY